MLLILIASKIALNDRKTMSTFEQEEDSKTDFGETTNDKQWQKLNSITSASACFSIRKSPNHEYNI